MFHRSSNRDRYEDDILPKPKKSQQIKAVGYELHLSQSALKTELEKKIDLSKYYIEDIIKSGVKYDRNCRGGLADAIDTQVNMRAWIDSRKGKQIDVYCKTIYVHPKLIIGECYVGNDRFFAVFSNMTSGSATTQHKKNVINGFYGPPIEIDRITIPSSAYVF